MGTVDTEVNIFYLDKNIMAFIYFIGLIDSNIQIKSSDLIFDSIIRI